MDIPANWKRKIHIFFRKMRRAAVLIPFLFVYTAEGKFDLSTSYSYYLTSSELKGPLDHYIDVGLDFSHHDFAQYWFYGMDIYSLFSMDSSHQNYIGSPSMYIAYGTDRIIEGWKINFVFGRYTLSSGQNISKDSPQINTGTWSFMDEVLDLGLWQGRARQDPLNPKQEGLAGSFITIAKKRWLLTFFISGIFFPDQGPAVDTTTEGIRSGSRWFAPLNSELILFSHRIDTFYWLKESYVKNIILNDSIAARFRFGSEKTQWLSLAFADKPVNQLYFAYDENFLISKTAVDADIYYQSFKHSLFSVDFGMKQGGFKAVLSVTQEIPRRPEVPEHLKTPNLPKALFLSSHFEFDFTEYPVPLELLTLNLLYSKFVYLPNKKQEEGQPTIDLKTNRFKLYSGFSIRARTKSLRLASQSISTEVSYWYSLPEEGGWLDLALRWQIGSRLALSTKIDILGVNNTQKTSFFNSYKHNDRIVVKMIYNIGS